jgi:uncharacterized membrane protein YjdF
LFFSLVGFVVFYWLSNKQAEVRSSMVSVCFFAFCFSLSCAVVWEVFEFTMDKIFLVTMGGDIFDTIYDMIAASLGTLILIFRTYWKLKRSPKWYFDFFFTPQKNLTIILE